MYRLTLALLTIALAACTSSDTHTFRSAVTGESCEPDVDTLVEAPASTDKQQPDNSNRGPGNNNGNHSPTGIPGDNLDDLRSGKVDCLGDGNSGQGDDKKHNCEIPPGCDVALCCDEDMYPDADPDGTNPDGDGDGSGDGSGDGDGSGSGSGDGDTCEFTCDSDFACGLEGRCVEGCCEVQVL